MNNALARSIAETTADVLGRRTAGATITDEAIGQHLWFDRGFREHDTLVQLINLVREIADQRLEPTQPGRRAPVQLSLNLEAA